MGRFARQAESVTGQQFSDYAALWQWSVDDLDGFWRLVSSELGVRWQTEPTSFLSQPTLDDGTMRAAQWCEGGRLNYAEQALRHTGDRPAVISRSQTRDEVVLSRDELRDQVARCQAGLRKLGVGPGSTVGAYLPNIAEIIVAFLATAALGARWASCAPEFGARSVIDRLGQVSPDVLFVVDGYGYGTKKVDRREEVARIREGLPSVQHTVLLPYLDPAVVLPDTLSWQDLLAAEGELSFEPVPFDHPLYVLFSSGTTGLPKPIIHGHGGMVLEHLKSLALHHDIGETDVFFWFTTTGWMMWNYLVSGLLVGSTVVCFDGNPAAPDLGEMWRLAEETGITVFGTAAPFLMACRKAGIVPREVADLSRLRVLGSTSAPLPTDGFTWVYEAVADPSSRESLLLSSFSGGTDVCSGFVGGAPLLPVRAGEISGRCLGCKVEAFDEDGHPVTGTQGELVISAPMPSMPIGLVGDSDGSRYRDSYFDVYQGIWRHGDWITIHDDGACIISGRSDATLNRGGVRLGTSEFYVVVEDLDEVADSLVIHLEDAGGGNGELLLFVVPASGDGQPVRPEQVDTEALAERVMRELRSNLSPRHVPDTLHVVAAVPRTLSGKKLEVPVKKVLTGTPPDRAASKESLVDPTALDAYVDFASRRGHASE